MHSFYISATHKSSGKTTISIGLSRLLSEMFSVQTYKKGPDYIDPIWLTQASGNPCYNLDFWNMPAEEITSLYHQHTKEVNIIEGNKGLFDGVSTRGGDANADIAKLTNIPVVLVIDCVGITRGVAPLLQGYINFDSEVNIIGVILNKVGGKRHEAKLRSAVEEYTDLTVFGAVPKHESLEIDERHLGLIPANEASAHNDTIDAITQVLREHINIQALLEATRHASTAKVYTTPSTHELTIAIAKDVSFGFYYNDDLDKLRQRATLVYIDTLSDTILPQCDALFIGGGFPEMHLESLSANTSLLTDIHRHITSGLPTYAECGGMMYLCKSIDGYPMAGVIDGDIEFTPKPVGRGYMKITSTHHLWNVSGELCTHEFHYSHLKNLTEDTFAFEVTRGVGITGTHDGIVKHNLLATYTHQRSVGSNNWIDAFIDFALQIQAKN